MLEQPHWGDILQMRDQYGFDLRQERHISPRRGLRF